MVFGQANHEHGVTYLVHHVVHMVVLQIRLVNNQGSFYEFPPKRKDVFQILVESPDLTLMEFNFQVHKGGFLGDDVGYHVEVAVGQGRILWF